MHNLRTQILVFGIGSRRNEIFLLCLVLALTTGLLLLSGTVTIQVAYSTTASEVTSQVFAQDSVGDEHEVKLRATEEDGRVNEIPGFTLTAERVPQIDEGKDLVVSVKIIDPTTGQLVSDTKPVDNIKITDSNTGQIIKEIKPTASNTFSLLGVKPGIYQLDVIVQLTDDTKGAYESILTVLAPGQNAPPADRVQDVQNTVITRNPDPVFIPVPVGVPVPVPTTPVAPPAPPQTLGAGQPPPPVTGLAAPPPPAAGQPPPPVTGLAAPPPPAAGQPLPSTPAAPPQTLGAGKQTDTCPTGVEKIEDCPPSSAPALPQSLGAGQSLTLPPLGTTDPNLGSASSA